MTPEPKALRRALQHPSVAALARSADDNQACRCSLLAQAIPRCPAKSAPAAAPCHPWALRWLPRRSRSAWPAWEGAYDQIDGRLAALEAAIEGLRAEISEQISDLHAETSGLWAESQQQMSVLRVEMRQDVSDLRGETRQ